MSPPRNGYGASEALQLALKRVACKEAAFAAVCRFGGSLGRRGSLGRGDDMMDLELQTDRKWASVVSAQWVGSEVRTDCKDLPVYCME